MRMIAERLLPTFRHDYGTPYQQLCYVQVHSQDYVDPIRSNPIRSFLEYPISHHSCIRSDYQLSCATYRIFGVMQQHAREII